MPRMLGLFPRDQEESWEGLKEGRRVETGGRDVVAMDEGLK